MYFLFKSRALVYCSSDFLLGEGLMHLCHLLIFFGVSIGSVSDWSKVQSSLVLTAGDDWLSGGLRHSQVSKVSRGVLIKCSYK